MTTDATRATAEAMPDIKRRRLLFGLAAASTAAAVVTAAEASSPAVGENPQLLRLAAELPAIVSAFQEGKTRYDAAYEEWDAQTPWAPDELTVWGTAWPHSDNDKGQPGSPEMKVLGGYLWRKGDQFPRRIVLKAWQIRSKIWDMRRLKRCAKNASAVGDFMAAEAEIKRLQKLYAIADAYEREFDEISSEAKAWHDVAYPPQAALQEALEMHVAAIMRELDHTVEGLLIKAQALAEWDRAHEGGRPIHKVAFLHGGDWHGQIAASILRHAQKGGAG